MNNPTPLVGLIMGSDSDWDTVQPAAEVLAEFGIPFEVGVVSAHRTPARMLAYAEQAADRGLKAIIACAGGAAHLPGMVAAATPLPGHSKTSTAWTLCCPSSKCPQEYPSRQYPSAERKTQASWQHESLPQPTPNCCSR